MTTAAKETIAVLKANGIGRIFGNPGTTELALLDATVSEGMEFHLCLNEGVATAMADGFGRATGSVGVVMVHTSVGTANALTNLINLRSDRSPLLVIAGDKDDRLGGRDCFCEVPDLPGLVRQVTKEAWRVTRPEKLPELVQRGLKVARAPTPGPVYIAVPENYMSAELAPEAVGVHARPAAAVTLRAHPEELRTVFRALARAQRPLLIAGNEVGAGGALPLLVELAEALCVPVLGEEVFTTSALNYPTDHALYHGNFAPGHPLARDADLVVAIGARAFMEYSYPSEPYLRPGVRFMQIGTDAGELGKIYPAELAVLGSVDAAIRDLHAMLDCEPLPAAEAMATRAARARRSVGSAPAGGAMRPVAAAGAMQPERLLAAMHAVLPRDAVVVDESVLSKTLLQRRFPLSPPRLYFGTSGGGLGWGIPAAIGVQLGLPRRRVVAFVGDGGALFNIQALWSAAHLRLPVVFVIVNNGGYMAVRRGLGEFGEAAVQAGRFPGSSIAGPEIDFCSLAEGLGVTALSVGDADQVADALRWALNLGAPALLDVLVAPSAYY